MTMKHQVHVEKNMDHRLPFQLPVQLKLVRLEHLPVMELLGEEGEALQMPALVDLTTVSPNHHF